MLPIYLVSLVDDSERRALLKERFSSYYTTFIDIEAVDGRILPAKEYYQKTLPYFIKYNKTMSPAEWGCTSSHIKALEAFLQTDEPYALILEDDVIGNDQDLDKIAELATKLDKDFLLLCGAQEGIDDRRYQLGKQLVDKRIYEVHPFSYPFVFRTCCYVVTRKSAQEILNYHIDCLTLADKWDEFFKGTTTKIYYAEILKHPEDLASSHIEAERRSQDKTFFKKLFSIDGPKKIYNKIYINFMALILQAIGFKRL